MLAQLLSIQSPRFVMTLPNRYKVKSLRTWTSWTPPGGLKCFWNWRGKYLINLRPPLGVCQAYHEPHQKCCFIVLQRLIKSLSEMKIWPCLLGIYMSGRSVLAMKQACSGRYWRALWTPSCGLNLNREITDQFQKHIMMQPYRAKD